MQHPVSAQPALKKRVIGPIPPRDKHGKLQLTPIKGKRVKTNILGEPVRDKDGNPLEYDADLREPHDYLAYEQGKEKEMRPESTNGLRLFQVDHDVEPLALVYARDADDAIRVYKREFGILRFGDTDPKVTPAE